MKVNPLLIVFKEEDREVYSHLKHLIESRDDESSTKNVRIRTLRCLDKQWFIYKKKDRLRKLAEKSLFIDCCDVMISEPVYTQYGITYGMTDQGDFGIRIDEKYEWTEDEYTEFLGELSQLTEDSSIAQTKAFVAEEEAKKKLKKKGVLFAVGLLFPPSMIAAGGLAVKDVSAAMKDSRLRREQMLFLAVTKFYLDELDAFMRG